MAQDPRIKWAKDNRENRFTREDGGLGVFSNWIAMDLQFVKRLPPHRSTSYPTNVLQLVQIVHVHQLTVARCDFWGRIKEPREIAVIEDLHIDHEDPDAVPVSLSRFLDYFDTFVYNVPEQWEHGSIATDNGILLQMEYPTPFTEFIQTQKPFRLLPQMIGLISEERRPRDVNAYESCPAVIAVVRDGLITTRENETFKLDKDGYWRSDAGLYFTILGTK